LPRHTALHEAPDVPRNQPDVGAVVVMVVVLATVVTVVVVVVVVMSETHATPLQLHSTFN
jgi:hypothetical protein